MMMKTRSSGKMQRERLEELQRIRLAKLVAFARKNSPYYRELYKNVGDDLRLSDLPPTSKPEIMANFDSVVTDRNITMKRIDEFTENIDNVGRMIDGKYLIFKTSGSTGNPAVVLMFSPLLPHCAHSPAARILTGSFLTASAPPEFSHITAFILPVVCRAIFSLRCRGKRRR